MRRMFRAAVGILVVIASLGQVTPSAADHQRSLYRHPHSLMAAGGKLFFVARDAAHGLELWKSRGTRVSTRIVRDIHTGLKNCDGYYCAETMSGLTAWNGDVYYERSTDTHGRELWKSDGTKEGTHIVKDLKGRAGLLPEELTVFGDSLYFVGNFAELWKTDGAEAGTVMVSDPGDFIRDLTILGETLFFKTTGFRRDTNEIWVSDGTPAGTDAVLTFNASAWCDSVRELYDVGGLLYFAVAETTPDGGCNEGLWRSDGTFAGTFKLRDLDFPEWGTHPVFEFKGEAVFVGRDPEHARELWKSDGTPEGASMIKDIYPGGNSSQLSAVAHNNPSPDPVLAGRYYFSASDGEHGQEVWMTDGTEAGTMMLADIRPGPEGSRPRMFKGVDFLGLMFFIAADGRHGFELWKSDGTAAGTETVKDINPRGRGLDRQSVGSFLIQLRGKLYFFATDGVHPFELWQTDGTSRGTKRVADL